MATFKTQVRARLSSTSFDCGGMQVRQLRGREAISEPFAFDVDLIAPRDSFDPVAALGKDVTIVLSLDDSDVRKIHGIVAEVLDEPDTTEGYLRHRLHVVPRLHRLALSATTEVFLDKSVVEIATDKLGRANLAGADVRTAGVQQPPRSAEFRLQYAETDLAFVSRLLERSGIAYSFDHSGDVDVLVLSDSNEAFTHAVGPESIPCISEAHDRGILDLRVRTTMMPARHHVNDYLPAHPKLDLDAESTVEGAYAGEIVDFGTGHRSPQEGADLARIRAQSRQAVAAGMEGVSNVPQIEAGHTISIDGHPIVGTDRLLVVWVEHRLTQGSVSGHDHADVDYECRFRATLASRPYRPEFRTPWPRIAGFVYGVTDAPPVGGTILDPLIDAEGRYTIRFYFDQADGAKRPLSSARVRMMQPHSGPGYGMHFPLKPGVEVAIAFYEGDPDRPIIAGSVPNPLTQTPVTSVNRKVNQIQSRSGIHITLKDS